MHKVQKSMKPGTEEKERKPNTATQSRRVLREKSLKSETDFSKSSRCQLLYNISELNLNTRNLPMRYYSKSVSLEELVHFFFSLCNSAF